MRVLIADDHPVVRRGIRSLLQGEGGLEVCGVAVDGQDAVAKAKELKPDAVVMDISMPGMNGLDATREIRRFLPQLPVVVLSHHEDPEIARQALNAGAVAYVWKSAASTDLLAVLAKIRSGEPLPSPVIHEPQRPNLAAEAPPPSPVAAPPAPRNPEFTTTSERRQKPSRWKAFADCVQTHASLRYAIAIVIAWAAIFFRVVFSPVLGPSNPYHFAWLAVVVSAWCCGIGPSILTVVIESLGVLYFVLPPYAHIEPSVTNLGGLFSFVVLSSIIVVLGELYRRDGKKRKAAEEQLIAYRDKLERLVEKRTSQLLGANRELSELSAQLLFTQDQERRQLARNLHDSVGQLLVALNMNLSAIAKAVQADPSLSAIADQSGALTEELIKEIRTTSYLLHPPLLDELGLVGALRHYLHGFSERSGIKVDMSISENFQKLPPEVELAIFRVVQEALTNVHRHSGSTGAAVTLRSQGNSLRVEIEDHGKGIPPDVLAGIRSSKSGVGMGGMRQRVRHLGGQMNIESSRSGTKLSVTVPIPQSAPEETPAAAPRVTGAA